MGAFWRKFVKGAFWISFALGVIAFVVIGILFIVTSSDFFVIGLISIIGGPILTFAAHAILGMLLEFFDNVAAIKNQICSGNSTSVTETDSASANSWQCINCGTFNSANSAFCDNCGRNRSSAFGGNQPWTAPVAPAPAPFVAPTPAPVAPAPAAHAAPTPAPVAPAPAAHAAPTPTPVAPAPAAHAAPTPTPVAPAPAAPTAVAVAEPADNTPKDWVCEICHGKNPANSIFCNNCGKPRN